MTKKTPMYNKIHTYTTDRITLKTTALLATYAVAVELLARMIGLFALLTYEFVVWDNSSLPNVVDVVLFAVAYGRTPVGYDVLAMSIFPEGISMFLIPFAVVGYVGAVAVVYAVHRRFVA